MSSEPRRGAGGGRRLRGSFFNNMAQGRGRPPGAEALGRWRRPWAWGAAWRRGSLLSRRSRGRAAWSRGRGGTAPRHPLLSAPAPREREAGGRGAAAGEGRGQLLGCLRGAARKGQRGLPGVGRSSSRCCCLGVRLPAESTRLKPWCEGRQLERGGFTSWGSEEWDAGARPSFPHPAWQSDGD